MAERAPNFVERRQREALNIRQRSRDKRLDMLIEINRAILDCVKPKQMSWIEHFWSIADKASALITIAGVYATFEFIYGLIKEK
jgi:hypothetical protein